MESIERPRVAACFSGWLNVSVPAAGALARQYLVKPLRADVFVAGTYKAKTDCAKCLEERIASLRRGPRHGLCGPRPTRYRGGVGTRRRSCWHCAGVRRRARRLPGSRTAAAAGAAECTPGLRLDCASHTSPYPRPWPWALAPSLTATTRYDSVASDILRQLHFSTTVTAREAGRGEGTSPAAAARPTGGGEGERERMERTGGSVSRRARRLPTLACPLSTKSVAHARSEANARQPRSTWWLGVKLGKVDLPAARALSPTGRTPGGSTSS